MVFPSDISQSPARTHPPWEHPRSFPEDRTLLCWSQARRGKQKGALQKKKNMDKTQTSIFLSIFVSFYLSIYLSIYLYIYLSIYLSIYIYIYVHIIYHIKFLAAWVLIFPNNKVAQLAKLTLTRVTSQHTRSFLRPRNQLRSLTLRQSLRQVLPRRRCHDVSLGEKQGDHSL